MEGNEKLVYKRRLNDFFSGKCAAKAGLLERRGAGNPLITGLEYDSRKVKAGNIYFALPGLHVDGHAFIDAAVKSGAAVIVHQNELAEYDKGIVYIRVKDSRFAMSPIADAFYASPSQSMIVIGVTGTEGKSTTVYLIAQLLRFTGHSAGFISTVMHGDGISDRWNPEHQTTPEAPTIHRLLARMRDTGAKAAVIEASSHGLSKKTNRLGDVIFDVGVMTNVTHEHLEFHGTWEQYRSDKAELFRSLDRPQKTHIKLKQTNNGARNLPALSFGVVNIDDPSASYFAGTTRHKTFTYSVHGGDADLSVRLIESGADGNWYEIHSAISDENIIIRDKLPGAFNAANVMASLLVVSNLFAIDIKELAAFVPRLKPVRGRMTAIIKGQPFETLVDYAHTPSSFETIFPPLRERLNNCGGRIITLFGSAGERDTKKRPEQGRIAAKWSDIVILSDEDPRGEKPMGILEDIAGGCEDREGAGHKTRGKDLFLIPGRPEAIRKAFSLARKGDLVLLLGKGHENSIIYANETMPYDEIAEAEKALEEMGF
jgi:UDP-N-acetylmuramoyl-L-alanyl-D-glutamate--2,6-diaminopimelate ligase